MWGTCGRIDNKADFDFDFDFEMSIVKKKKKTFKSIDHQ